MAKTRVKTKALPVKTKIAGFKLTPEQYALIEARAARRGLPISAWMRAILLQAASAPMNGRYIRIHEPDGAIT